MSQDALGPERLDQLERWLHIDATSGSEAAYLTALEADLRAEGLHVTRHPIEGQDPDARWNLLAHGGTPEIVLCTHVDTVPPFLPVRRTPDALWGRGACDTKGVQLAMIAAMARIKAIDPALAARVGLLLVSGEETDHCGAVAAANMGLRARRFILGEPTRGLVAAGQKGILKVRLAAEGKAGHSAFPETGHSAIHALLDAIERVRSAPWPDDPVLGPTTLNIGVIEGGVAANVFAPAASAVLMFRAVSDTRALEASVRQAASGAGIGVEILSRAEPQRFSPPDSFETCIIPFNSDAAWLAPLAPVWLAGPGDIRLAHSVREHITIDDLNCGVDLYVRLIVAASIDLFP